MPLRTSATVFNLMPRSEPSAGNNTTSNLCLSLSSSSDSQVLISRRTLIVTLALCALLTLLSMAAASLLLYREIARRRQTKVAKKWGRQSRFNHRISLMRKEIDTEYSKHYTGYLQHEPENPEMGSDSPVEMMPPERLCEVPAIPALAANKNAGTPKGRWKTMSLVFDQGVGMWMPKRERTVT
ncbi:uncharacterized protein LTR77_005929 [Saxophila tyrrhenica]|uniref:Uncharacterized protein n=1 Tax=Saxophila tyrrhenica TaxID=1690608 RepID=A0AAV9PAN0_9PEZI|nr:hypothetical protein LTR77_005929 [Saxophila tyrrhenica]